MEPMSKDVAAVGLSVRRLRTELFLTLRQSKIRSGRARHANNSDKTEPVIIANGAQNSFSQTGEAGSIGLNVTF